MPRTAITSFCHFIMFNFCKSWRISAPLCRTIAFGHAFDSPRKTDWMKFPRKDAPEPLSPLFITFFLFYTLLLLFNFCKSWRISAPLCRTIAFGHAFDSPRKTDWMKFPRKDAPNRYHLFLSLYYV